MNYLQTATTAAASALNLVTTSELFGQLKDTVTETGKAAVATTSAAAGTLLVTATATRLATEGLAGYAPKTAEEAEAMILAAMNLVSDKVDTDKSSNTEDKETESEQAEKVEETAK